MRKEYDFSKGERGKFYGKVDTKNPIIETDGTLDEIFEDELEVLESNLTRIKTSSRVFQNSTVQPAKKLPNVFQTQAKF